jgi:hypothetical protein
MKIKIILVIILLLLIFYNNFKYVENFIHLNIVVPKNIYVFLEDNPFALKNLESLVFKTHKEWKILSLTQTNITKYTYFKNLSKYNNFKTKMFKDLVALEILHKNGGIYMDNEIVIKNFSKFNDYVSEVYYKGYDCCLLKFTNNSKKYPINSWVYISPKKSKFLKRLHLLLRKSYQKNPNIDLYKLKDAIIKNLFDDYNYSVYKRNEKGNMFYGITLGKSYKNLISSKYIEKYYREPPIF